MAKEKTAFGSRKCKALLTKRDQVERLISFGLFDDAPDDLTDLARPPLLYVGIKCFFLRSRSSWRYLSTLGDVKMSALQHSEMRKPRA
ncbi:MAG: hypothetical protein J6W28_06335, partial [Clostridia bacterium]|nr:hypothetical protein [Clostridia bacterium]